MHGGARKRTAVAIEEGRRDFMGGLGLRRGGEEGSGQSWDWGWQGDNEKAAVVADSGGGVAGVVWEWKEGG